jgi:hypothetical protein
MVFTPSSWWVDSVVDIAATRMDASNIAGFVFVAFSNNFGSSVVVKLDAATMAEVARYTEPTGTTFVTHALVEKHNNTHLLVVLDISPPQVVKIDIATMAEVSRWTPVAGSSAVSLSSDSDAEFYVGCSGATGDVVKVDLATMAEISRWVGGIDNILNLISDNLYVYAALDCVPMQIKKIRKSDMTVVLTWTGNAGDKGPDRLLLDGSGNLYTCTEDWPNDTMVIKINTATMAEVTRWNSVAGDGPAVDMAIDTGLCVLLVMCQLADGGKGTVVKLNTTTMLETDRWVPTDPLQYKIGSGCYNVPSAIFYTVSEPSFFGGTDPPQVAKWNLASASIPFAHKAYSLSRRSL